LTISCIVSHGLNRNNSGLVIFYCSSNLFIYTFGISFGLEIVILVSLLLDRIKYGFLDSCKAFDKWTFRFHFIVEWVVCVSDRIWISLFVFLSPFFLLSPVYQWLSLFSYYVQVDLVPNYSISHNLSIYLWFIWVCDLKITILKRAIWKPLFLKTQWTVW
jgi:hypothetical protein